MNASEEFVERPAGWLRGVLEPCILALVSEGESYGYELTVRLEAAGLGKVAGGSLYPALARLEKQGLVTADWRAGESGPGRKFYAITAAGRATLVEQAVRWDDFASAVCRLLNGTGTPKPAARAARSASSGRGAGAKGGRG